MFPEQKDISFLRNSPQIEAAGLGRHNNYVIVIVDMDGVKARWMSDVSPCLTRNRSAFGFYLPACGRRVTLAGQFKLQAIPSG